MQLKGDYVMSKKKPQINLKAMNALQDKGGMVTLRDATYAEVSDRLPFFIPSIDNLTGGGLPFGRMVEVSGTPSSGKSITKDSIIATAEGLRSFEDILSEKRIPTTVNELGTEPIEFEEEVILINKDGVKEKATHIQYNGVKPVYEFIGEYGGRIKTSATHPLYAIPWETEKNSPTWIEAKDLQVGDAMIYLNNTSPEMNPDVKSLDEYNILHSLITLPASEVLTVRPHIPFFSRKRDAYVISLVLDRNNEEVAKRLDGNIQQIISSYRNATSKFISIDEVTEFSSDPYEGNPHTVMTIEVDKKMYKNIRKNWNKRLWVMQPPTARSKAQFMQSVSGRRRHGYKMFERYNARKDAGTYLGSARYGGAIARAEEIVKVNKLASEPLFDFTLPETHTFIANSYVNHNSHLCYHAVKVAVDLGVYVILYDVEGSADNTRMEELGIDTSKVLVRQPDPTKGEILIIETIAESIEESIKAINKEDPNARILILWDSVGQTMSKLEFEQKYGEMNYGAKAKAITQMVGKLSPLIAHTKTLFLAINQIRDNMDAGLFGKKTQTPGGRAWEHYASLRIETRKGKTHHRTKDGEKEIYGHVMRLIGIKNKVGTPYIQAEVDFLLDTGIDYEHNLVELGVATGVLTETGRSVEMVDENGELHKKQKTLFVEWLKDVTDETANTVRRNLLERLTYTYFPDGFVAMDNEFVDVTNFADAEKFDALWKPPAPEKEEKPKADKKK